MEPGDLKEPSAGIIELCENDNLNRFSQFLSKHGKYEFPTKEGWLKKKSPSLVKGWQKRYFVLSDKKLFYYKNEKRNKLLGVINFDQVAVEVQLKPQENPTQVVIIPMRHKRKFKLKSKTPEDLQTWKAALQETVNISEGRKNKSVHYSISSKFWRHESISDKDFRMRVTTGDIVLFRSKNLTAKLMRGLTRSQYDHVALALRYESGDIALLEATNNEGVNIVYWEDFYFNDWFREYDRIVFRHLEVHRTDQMVAELENFLEATLGKKYGISAKKIFSRFRNSEDDTEEKFFCSELVAAAYRQIGVLAESIAPSTIWPGDFSGTSTKLHLVKARLCPEQVIDINLR